MKRFLPLLTALLLSACLPQDNGAFHGYMEGEFVMIAPTSTGPLETLSVRRGDTVERGADLFALDRTSLAAARDGAKAALDRAQAQLDDIEKGARPEEIQLLQHQKEQAQAGLVYAQKEYNRIKPLVKRGAESQSALDKAKSDLDSAAARIKEIEADIAVNNMPARTDQITAARAAVDEARQTLAQAEKTLAEAAPKAPASGTIEDTFYRPGEVVPAGKPVISLLPPENLKARFFVPQAVLPKLHQGQPVTITCDGCSAPLKGKITFIAAQAEYTPPVIYSVESRHKLVFMVEATPDTPETDVTTLHPGLPVDVRVERDKMP